MTVINLSEQYLRNNNPTLLERIQLFIDLDVYYSSSFRAIDRHFDRYPSTRKGSFNLPSALVLMQDISIRKYRHDESFDENNPEDLKSLDKALHFPAFEIDDSEDTRVAFFGAKKEDYLQDIRKYGLIQNSHARLPKIYFEYIDSKPRRMLMIKSFGTVKGAIRESLLEKMILKNNVISLRR